MEITYLKSNQIFLEDEIISGYIKIEDERISDILKAIPDDVEYIDYGDRIIAPGYFDTHIHGYGGHDIMDGTREALLAISEGIVSTGITSFLATTLTDSRENLNKVCKNIGDFYKDCRGAKVEGIFLEGPFFTEKYKGAQNLKYMSDPSMDILEEWHTLADRKIKKIAIAPEREGSLDFIKNSKREGIYVALGHSDATYEEAKAAMDAGASIFVHTYNAMSGLHHRNPGMLGAALSSDDTYCELICDGFHVHPASAKVVMKAKSRLKTVLITDCMMAGGMPEGDYKLGEFDVKVQQGTAKLRDGALAGSILKLCDAVKNVYHWGIATKHEAVNMASIVPAKSVGLEHSIGSIAIGKYADLNILDDDLNVLETYINGRRFAK